MKRLIDVVTVILLAVAFILLYHTGFVATTATGEQVLATNTMALISIIGMGVLFGMGGVATAVDRIKRGTVTKSFLVLFIVQIFSFIGMIAIMAFLLLQMFTVESTVLRALYIIFSMTGVIGYVDSMLYTDCAAEADKEAADEAEDDCDDVDEDDIEDEDVDDDDVDDDYDYDDVDEDELDEDENDANGE